MILDQDLKKVREGVMQTLSSYSMPLLGAGIITVNDSGKVFILELNRMWGMRRWDK